MKSSNNLSKELSNFINFMDGLRCFSLPTSRKKEQRDSSEATTIYKHGTVSVALVPVGNPDVIRGTYYGYEPYVDFIENTAQKGICTFYLLARGKINNLIADATAKIVESRNSLKVTDRYVDQVEMNGKKVQTLLLRLENDHTCLQPSDAEKRASQHKS